MHYAKYHALGNDYLVIEPTEISAPLSEAAIQRICHRNFGVGSDGILLGPSATAEADFALRIYNPDGSEAEKSGNGLRIFSRYLWDKRLVGADPFTIMTLGGKVRSQVHTGGRSVTVEMGQVSFDSRNIPVAGPDREVLNETICVGDREFLYCAATIGNPHSVLPLDEPVTPELAMRYGPLLETEARFPNRTNVQFLNVQDRANIRIEIWERGAGYTLASGSSSSAAAAVAHRLGLCDEQITVHMPGGKIAITIDKDYRIEMTGPVTRVGDGVIDEEVFTY